MMLKKSIKYKQVKELEFPEGKNKHIIKDEIKSLSEEKNKRIITKEYNPSCNI